MRTVISHKDLKGDPVRGGICTLYSNLTIRLANLGAKITTISAWPDRLSSKIHHIQIPYSSPEQFSMEISKILQVLDFDIYECSSWHAEGLAYSRLSQHLPIVVRGDLSAPYFKDEVEIARERELIRNANCVLAVSKFCANDIKRCYKIQVDKVIHNGVNLSIFKPQTKVNGIPEKTRVAWVGKPTLLKGIDILKKIIEKSPKNIVFDIVMGHAKAEVSLNFLRNPKVRTYKDIPVKQLVSLYQKASFYLSTSRQEGFGLAALEAMACNTPVLLPKDVKPYFQFVNEKSGHFYDSPDEAVSLFNNFIDNKKKNSHYFRPRDQAKKFDWDKCAKATINAYKELLARPK